jgi:hypothetical protein
MSGFSWSELAATGQRWLAMPKQPNSAPGKKPPAPSVKVPWAGKLFGGRDTLMRLKLVGAQNSFGASRPESTFLRGD